MSKHSPRRSRSRQEHHGRVTAPEPRPVAMLVICDCCDSWWSVVPGVPGSSRLLIPGTVPDDHTPPA
jgi:hypothetical protein